MLQALVYENLIDLTKEEEGSVYLKAKLYGYFNSNRISLVAIHLGHFLLLWLLAIIAIVVLIDDLLHALLYHVLHETLKYPFSDLFLIRDFRIALRLTSIDF
jgi:hypothetical protein